MKIKIEDKTYEQLKFKGRIIRDVLQIKSILEDRAASEDFRTEDVDLICEFIVNTFDNQFTTDDLLDGLEFPEIIIYFRQISTDVMTKSNNKLGALIKK